MVKCIFLLILVFLCSCGKKTNYKTSVYIETEAIPYVEKFSQLSGLKINDLHVSFKEMDMKLGGYCDKVEKIEETPFEKTITKTPKVFININHWNSTTMTKASKELLVFHELGHCLLNRAHVDDQIYVEPTDRYYSNYLFWAYGYNFYANSDGLLTVPKSVMTPTMFFSEVYSEYYSHYMGELFNNYEQYASYEFSDKNYAMEMNKNITPEILEQIMKEKEQYTDYSEVHNCEKTKEELNNEIN